MSYKFTQQSNSARSVILQKLKKQVEGADYDKLPAETGFTYPEISFEDQFTHFVQLLRNNQAKVISTSETELMPQVISELKARDISSLLYGADSPYSQLIEQGINQSGEQVELQDYDYQLTDNKDKLFNHTPASITSSNWAIAETGTIVRWPSQNEPRTMSLVPPVHMIIVDANKLYCNFSSLVKDQNWKDNMPTNALLISGPSKTADIQQTLAFGAHGPKELIVFVMNSPTDINL